VNRGERPLTLWAVRLQIAFVDSGAKASGNGHLDEWSALTPRKPSY
jgi:hypothetical protein